MTTLDQTPPSFSAFARLPLELRNRVWSLTVETRIVPITFWIGNVRANQVGADAKGWRRALNRQPKLAAENPTGLPMVPYAASPLKPTLMDVCKESRAVALTEYEKLILEPDLGVSYAWVNLDKDILHIDENENFSRLSHCSHKIKRLMVDGDIYDDLWCHVRFQDIFMFKNLVECYIVTKNEWEDWAGEDEWRPDDLISPENIYIVKENGETKSAAEIDATIR